MKTRIAETRRGDELLAAEVATARDKALAAVEAYRKSKMSVLYNEADKKMNVTAEAIDAEPHLQDLLNQATLAWRTQQIVRRHIEAGESAGAAGISGKLKAILEPAKTTTPAVPSAQTEPVEKDATGDSKA